MKPEKLSQAQFAVILAAQPTPIDPSETAAGSTVVSLLSSLDRKVLDQVMVEQRFSPGEIVVHEGQYGDIAFLIWSGRVAVVQGNFNNPASVNYRGPGEVVGEMSLIDNKPRSASIVALDDVRLLGIYRKDFFELLQIDSSFSTNMMEILSNRLRAAEEMSRVNTAIGRELSAEVEVLQSENEALRQLEQRRQELSELVVHDLRNPLGNLFSALNMLELVLPQEILAENRELLEIARLSHLRMQDLVDSLLDIAQIDAGRPLGNYKPTNLPALMKEVLMLNVFALNKREMTLTQNFPEDLPSVLADPNQIRRVLTNLVDNAIKYSPKGGALTVTAVRHDNMVQVSVTDAGPGVSPVERERIFERFTQAETGGIRPRGFGLGLSYCKLAVEAHNGRIWVEPGPDGVGSRFVFTLPIVV
ncbi:MAG: cyclic nucleotide-binding domain-containing protein [Anaerolineales bacterium]|nr:cyclic nucleotide-binding domain-containing protein [Anaerolineales bacterium]MCB8937916.1 cyclic nucleotide-binding domain-containing protein [Ardenticatenaceae bacterium]